MRRKYEQVKNKKKVQKSFRNEYEKGLSQIPLLKANESEDKIRYILIFNKNVH